MWNRALIFLAGCLLSWCAQAGCSLPPAPSKIPDAESATQEEMVAALQVLSRYNKDVSSYLKCLEFEAKQNRISTDEQTRLHNTAVDTLQGIAEKFNAQVRIFKAKHG